MSRGLILDAIGLPGTEAQQTLAVLAIQTQNHHVNGTLLASGLVGLAGLVSVLPVWRAVFSSRTAVHTGIFALMVALLLGAGARLESETHRLMEWTRPYTERRAEALVSLGVDLPAATAAHASVGDAQLTVSTRQVWLNGEGFDTQLQAGLPTALLEGLQDAVQQANAPSRAELNLEIDHRVRMDQLRPLIAAAQAGGVAHYCLVVQPQPGQLACIHLSLSATPRDTAENPFPESRAIALPPSGEDSFMALERIPMDILMEVPEEDANPLPPLALQVDGTGATLQGLSLDAPVRQAAPSELGAVLGPLKSAHPDEDAIDVHVSPDQQVAQLVAWLDAVRADFPDITVDLDGAP